FGSLPRPVKQGYIFMGWHCWDIGLVTNESVVSFLASHWGLFAQWEAQPEIGRVDILDRYITHAWQTDVNEFSVFFNSNWWWGMGGGANESSSVLGFGFDRINPVVVGFELYSIWSGVLRFVPDLGTMIEHDDGSISGSISIEGKVLMGGEFFTTGRVVFTLCWSSEIRLITPISLFPHHDPFNPPRLAIRIVIRTVCCCNWCYIDKIPLTVDFDLQGGFGAAEPIILDFMQNYGELPYLVFKTDYVFAGWFTKPNGQGQQIFYNSLVLLSGTKTLYAHWERGIVVYLDGQGGQVDIDQVIINCPSAYGWLPNPTKPGFLFDGWWTEPFGGIRINENTPLVVDTMHVIFARWIPKFW
ncbi:MAG: InlB B-repeat-containing protein, partial [Firmicutes bacterium]|nr:InlB B-repeat-containing protein [Bacillota bacterium]